MASCHKRDGINVLQSVDTSEWDTNDTLFFEVPATQEEGYFDLSLQTRITRKYAYENLWIVVEQAYQADSLLGIKPQHYIDTICMQLTNESGDFSGYGKDLLEYTVPIRQVHLPQSMEGKISLHHIMSSTTINGVHDIGVALSLSDTIGDAPVSAGINTQKDKKQDGEAPKR